MRALRLFCTLKSSSLAWRRFSSVRSLNVESSTSMRLSRCIRKGKPVVAQVFQVGDGVQAIGPARMAGDEDQVALLETLFWPTSGSA